MDLFARKRLNALKIAASEPTILHQNGCLDILQMEGPARVDECLDGAIDRLSALLVELLKSTCKTWYLITHFFL